MIYNGEKNINLFYWGNYRNKAYGETCNTNAIILSEDECESAIESLGYTIPSQRQVIERSDTPAGCSYNGVHMYYNSHQLNTGRSNFKPICRKWTFTFSFFLSLFLFLWACRGGGGDGPRVSEAIIGTFLGSSLETLTRHFWSPEVPLTIISIWEIHGSGSKGIWRAC